QILVLFVEKLCFSTTRGLERGAEAPREVRFAEMNSANRGWDLFPKNSCFLLPLRGNKVL
ncbi:MAG: hypothetical protein LBF64_06970, partial [Oscillospiraceae bacterium]|nr:hypothetical protein [Oscillospiraceae bacterium]